MAVNNPGPEAIVSRMEEQAERSGQHVAQARYIEAPDHEGIFKPHAFPEHTVDLGEVRMNYAVAGSKSDPALLLIPSQSESWWGYEDAMRLLSGSYQVYAVDLRGQGRSTWTPGRYTLDNFGNDLVRLIDLVIKRPVVVAGLSSGGVLSAWLSAFAKPGQILAAVYEDPPLFASEAAPAMGPSIRQAFAGPIFCTWYKWLGPQWSIGDVDGMRRAMAAEMPAWVARALEGEMSIESIVGSSPALREYDPEWANSFWSGRVGMACDHESMLKHVKVPVLLTHHFRKVDEETGNLVGALTDEQSGLVGRLVDGGGNSFTYKSFPAMPHSMHGHDPICYVTAVTEWLEERGLGKALKPTLDQLPKKEESGGHGSA